jgi:uncharacterized membrane protein
MPEFLQTTTAHVVILVAVCVALGVVGFYVVDKVRRNLRTDTADSHDLLTNFRELHSQGDLSDDEYRTIKTMLAARLQEELKGKGKEG